MKGKALGLLAILGLGAYALGRKKGDGDGGGDGALVLTYDELKDSPERTIEMETGGIVAIELPGLAEQWSIEVSGGGGQALSDILGIESAASRGVVIYRFTTKEAEPWAGRVTFKLNGTPDVDFQIRYVG